jgi:hypothetical protein
MASGAPDNSIQSIKALCTDFYVNMKVGVKMELPRTRETVLDLFERVRRQHPQMRSFRKYRDELALESTPGEFPQRWVALRSTSVRSGVVNAESFAECYELHKHVLHVAPAYLTLSPLDVEHIELLYGFDLSASGNHDEIVMDALLSGSPMHTMLDLPESQPSKFEPSVTMLLGKNRDIEATFEVRTRAGDSRGAEARPRDVEPGSEPISVYLLLRKHGSMTDLNELTQVLERLSRLGEALVSKRVLPGVISPLRQAIAAR